MEKRVRKTEKKTSRKTDANKEMNGPKETKKENRNRKIITKPEKAASKYLAKTPPKYQDKKGDGETDDDEAEIADHSASALSLFASYLPDLSIYQM